ncbi:type II toxin-antitoxin system PemK/MazF family toxin [Microlunatus elymi]|uniref:Type II toxin-antitoxin system PemK/MazF family toxin n=1 Tax=Microlunatus elymi TaxID=2596828 RepID=A0A516PYG7_9ACTN|nr:type II toxin-antitoxin system PemK/MazF family toxin [Microlunatus elymi]QDP96217.1 type II toxin-antitoxin system PemK/MazF family toxin [Microlunatus elymi]
MKRGDIWIGAGTGYASKPRPVLVIQNDRFDATDSVLVVPFTSADADAPLARLQVEPDATNGLDKRSWLQIDKLGPVKRVNLRSRLGELDEDLLRQLTPMITLFLGLGQ